MPTLIIHSAAETIWQRWCVQRRQRSIKRLSLCLLDIIVGQTDEVLFSSFGLAVYEVEVAVTTDATCELHVLLHDSLTFCVDGAQIGVLEKCNDVGFGRLLKRLDSL